MYFRQILHEEKSCASYLVGCPTLGVCVVVDAQGEPGAYINQLEQHGLKVSAVIETHVHADHLSRAHELRRRTGARLVVPVQSRASFAYTAARDRDTWGLGSRAALFTAIHTPGHTAESMCVVLGDRLLFTGDTLFLDGVGRPDLEAGVGEAEARARDLYRSLRRIRQLPRETTVLPAHASAAIPFDGIPLAASMAEIEKRVANLDRDEEHFVSAILEAIPPAPANFARIVQLNEGGEMPAEDELDLEAGANRCAVS